MTTICVTGMHRSGTSPVARVVNLLGVDLGAEAQLMESRPDNPTGFWESGPITALNDDLLDHLGGRWDHPPVLDDGWETSAALDTWRDRARGVLRSAFGESALRGWKDPRMSILLPFWRTVTDVSATVIVLRRPSDVAASLSARDGMDASDGAYLWVRYMAAALRAAPDALVLDYDSFLSNPHGAIELLVDFLGIAPPPERNQREVDEFLDPGLRHHHDDAPDEATVPGEMLLADFLYGAAREGLGPVVAEALHRLEDVRGGEVVRLIEHRDDLIRERDKAQSVLEDAWADGEGTADRLAAQSEALRSLEAAYRHLGTELAARDTELQRAQERILKLEGGLGPMWRRLRAHVRPSVVKDGP